MSTTRRQFLATGTATAGLTLLTSALKLPATSQNSPLKPPRLKPGDGVGLISPAGANFLKGDLEIVLDAVRGLGLTPYLAPHLLDRYGYLAGKDRDRAADVNQFFADPNISILLPIRGGWGCARILPYLDYEIIRRHPKIIIGFSDITTLILGINAKTNLVTFHGPNGFSSWRTPQTDLFNRILFLGEKITFINPKDGDDSDRLMQVKNRIQTITPGKARGKLMGGNLSVLSAIIGSPYLPNLKGAILFLEDVGENIYRLDRMITHLKVTGLLNQLAGFIFGQCVNCTPDPDYASLTLEEVLEDHIQPLGIPAYYGAQIGHLEILWTLPLGTEVEIDANLGTIEMLESAVI
jgi:muramoyltetrapeptide carboxypeptidase